MSSDAATALLAIDAQIALERKHTSDLVTDLKKQRDAMLTPLLSQREALLREIALQMFDASFKTNCVYSGFLLVEVPYGHPLHGHCGCIDDMFARDGCPFSDHNAHMSVHMGVSVTVVSNSVTIKESSTFIQMEVDPLEWPVERSNIAKQWIEAQFPLIKSVEEGTRSTIPDTPATLVVRPH